MVCNNLQFLNLAVSLLKKWNLFWISGSCLVPLHQDIHQVETDDHTEYCSQYVDEKWLHQHPWPHLIPLLRLFFLRVNFLSDIQQSNLSGGKITRLAGLGGDCISHDKQTFALTWCDPSSYLNLLLMTMFSYSSLGLKLFLWARSSESYCSREQQYLNIRNIYEVVRSKSHTNIFNLHFGIWIRHEPT